MLRPSLFIAVAMSVFACKVSKKEANVAKSEVSAKAEKIETEYYDDTKENLVKIVISSMPVELILAEASVTAGIAGQSAFQMNFVLSKDINGDGKLGTGDELTIVEPLVDWLKPEMKGKELFLSESLRYFW